MKLRDTTVAGLCAFLGILALLMPMPVFGGPYEEINPDEIEWTCSMPILSLAPADVDLDEVRDAIDMAHKKASSTPGGYVPPQSQHPLCKGLARTQVVLALLAFLGGGWRFTVWWRTSADSRAEKRFKRLQESASGDRSGLLR